MENNKKQQNYSRSGNSKTSTTTDSSRQKSSSSSDLQSTKHWPKNSRRRENPQTSTRNGNNNTNSKQQQQASGKVRPYVDKRPRARGYAGNNNNYGAGGPFGNTTNDYFASGPGLVPDPTIYGSFGEGPLDDRYESQRDYELNSVYSPGCKKQNLNHLLNFYYTPRDADHYEGAGGGNSANGRHFGHVRKPKYNKEQFIQANFQFVIKASAKRKTDDSPDTLIDWALIEQINIQTPEELQCPICLYPPVAGKVTRCGHVYCWPCVLHYLSLSDKTWRKCPICYDAVHVGDLKSASVVQQNTFSVGAQITFRLMRRKKGSFLIEQFENWHNDENLEKYPYVSSPMEEKLFSKFILATRNDVADILARERKELLTDVDETCPEFVFIQQAMEMLRERSVKLGETDAKDDAETMNKVMEITNTIENNENLNYEVMDNNEKSKNEFYKNDTIAENAYSEAEMSLTTVIENLEENLSEIAAKSSSSLSLIKYYYFYQAEDGQNIYLHPLNVKMLQACYGSLAEAPAIIKARILQKEQHSMDEEHRRKFTCLGHLPLTCEFSVLEVELQPPYVTEDIIKVFKTDILHRKNERKRRAREEREREKHINAINDRQMGKLIASTANINISSCQEFPSCGFEEALSANSDLLENTASTSKGATRKKTISTSSAGSCSYSSIALHCQQEPTPWGIVASNQKPKSVGVVKPTSDDEETSILNSIQTNLGDVLAQALSQKKQKKSDKSLENLQANNAAGANKKSKKSKKMLPLYSTGMNFSGN